MVRLRILHRFILAGFIFLALALFYYQISKFNRYQQLSQVNRIRILPQLARRGFILDRNGNSLAGNKLSYDLLIMPKDGNYPVEQISKLSSVISIPPEELKSKYNKGYVAPFIPVLLYKDISLSHAVAIGQLRYDLPELIIQAKPKRIYPLGSISSHVLGYLSSINAWRLERLKHLGYKFRDLVGYSGVEEIYDFILRPKEGGMQVEVDNKGRITRIIGFKNPQEGKNIRLTIDLKIQQIVHNSLIGQTGCVIVLNPDNGDILAMASFPDFNPQVFQDGTFSEINSLLNDPDAPLFNRAISGGYPPGSIFKVIVATAGLEKKVIDTETNFFCSGKKKIGDRQFSCWNTHGEQNIVAAIAHSCNVFFYNLGLRLGPQLINEYALRFGLSQASGVDLSSESSGSIPYSLWQRIRGYSNWFAGDTANLSIGQGDVLVTPLQIARVMAAFANGGKLIKPGLLKSINDGKRIINPPPRETVNLSINKDTLQIIRKGLVGAVKDPGGTANVLANMNISIAGKTGTVQVSSGQAHGWFAGYFPVEKPRYVICVFLEHTGAGYYSCQLARRIIEQMLAEKLI